LLAGWFLDFQMTQNGSKYYYGLITHGKILSQGTRMWNINVLVHNVRKL
jgi:hypothetical protein